MSLLALLRTLGATGIGLSADSQELDVEGPADAVTAELVAAIREHKVALRRLLDPTALRVHFQVPADHPRIDPTLAVVMVRLATERKAFTDAERAAYATRVAERQSSEKRYLAQLFAIEDVVRSRETVLSPPLQTESEAGPCSVAGS
jgi:hypothetical protein